MANFVLFLREWRHRWPNPAKSLQAQRDRDIEAMRARVKHARDLLDLGANREGLVIGGR